MDSMSDQEIFNMVFKDEFHRECLNSTINRAYERNRIVKIYTREPYLPLPIKEYFSKNNFKHYDEILPRLNHINYGSFDRSLLEYFIRINNTL